MADTFEAGNVTLEKVRENVWEMPQEGQMRVPARVFASERLLEEISGDLTLEQLRNTTHLPGITKYAICMPDGHQGYGFPVGGVGAMDAENGCISPGAVGYDINCVTGDTAVRLAFGRFSRIEALADRFESERAVVADGALEPSPIHLFTRRAEADVVVVRTRTGDTIRTTTDHPFVTPSGKQPVADLAEGDTVYLHPFRGIENDVPDEFVTLDHAALAGADPPVIAELERMDLLPLTSTDEAFQILLKLVGYHTAAGSFGEARERTWFYGEPADLRTIQDDIARIGFTPSAIIDNEGLPDADDPSAEAWASGIRIDDAGFRRLLEALGAPHGPTVERDAGLPWYIDRLADWQTALYLSTFFGAAMRAPAASADGDLAAPMITLYRSRSNAEAARTLLSGIGDALEGLRIVTNRVTVIETDSNRDEARWCVQLDLDDDPANLRQFFSTVGYRYAQEKRRRSIAALQYLKGSTPAGTLRSTHAEEPSAIADGGMASTAGEFRDDVEDRKPDAASPPRSDGGACSRPPTEDAGFEAYRDRVTVRDDLTVAVEIESIEPAGTETVYDIGVSHDAHTFIANGFTVSNCGVRMVKTNLDYDDVQGSEQELVDALFANVPSGLGAGGIVEGSTATVETVLDRGMEWALEEGYAVEADLAHCEDEGVRPESDPETVSDRAKDRGRKQIGSLGSGNHFLEVQRVTDVFREEVAAAFGLDIDQIVVLIHCGSRGLGHQVCTDYLRKIEQTHADLLETLPDKELAAAPAGSELAEQYYRAMCASINFAWVNRQLVMYQTRRVFEDVFGEDWEALGMDLLYDVAHNIAKREVHEVDGEQRELFVHRKGATRAFPAGRPELPEAYATVGQPILLPGSMGSGSYVLRGGEHSLDLTFGSTAHGAGRIMSRTQAKQEFWGGDVQTDLRDQQRIYVKADSGATIAEEAPGVYKDVDEVVRVSDALGIGDRVARTFPVANIKG